MDLAQTNIFRFLSRDTLVLIFKQLPKKTLLKLMQTCKQFYHAARDERLWRQLDFSGTRKNSENELIVSLVHRIARKGFVTHLSFAKNTKIDIWCIVKAVKLAGKSLVALNISSVKKIEKKFAKLFELAPNITDLNISNMAPTTTLTLLSKLRRLNMSHFPSDIYLEDIQFPTSLETLDISVRSEQRYFKERNTQRFKQDIGLVVSKLPKLKTLVCSGNRMKENAIESTSLTSLNMANCVVDTQFVTSVLTSCTNLTNLVTHDTGNWRMDFARVMSALSLATSLTSLTVFLFCPRYIAREEGIQRQPHDVFWDAIEMLVNLKSLSIFGEGNFKQEKTKTFSDQLLTLSIRGLTVEKVEELLTAFPNLINFQMSINQAVTNVNLVSEKLETVRISNCPFLTNFKVTSSSIQNLSCDSNPRLKIFEVISPNLEILRMKGLALETNLLLLSMPKLRSLQYNRMVYLWPTMGDIPVHKLKEYGTSLNVNLENLLKSIAPNCKLEFRGTLIHVRPLRVWAYKRSPARVIYLDPNFKMCLHFTDIKLINSICGIERDPERELKEYEEDGCRSVVHPTLPMYHFELKKSE